ncbi:lysophospholipid acyltransferase family protein [Pseudonocardia sp. GCM10023141]|uniref:lysophospholipid acyltransferase family protein n=1 Tax=Pseudonocardia sp. GCM10023141 TaxID=3252653 RepID=UPI003606B8A1
MTALMPALAALAAPPAHPTTVAGGWAPSSPCTPDCLPAEGPTVGRVRVAARLTGMATVLLAAVALASVLPATLRARWLQACCRAVLRAAGVRLRIRGTIEPGGLVVANHLSWLDILALDALTPLRMLAKTEVRGWPVIGGLAARTGAVFVDRAGLHALPAVVAGTADALRSGATVGVFPEGTTWCGAAAGRFRRAAFQAAIDAGATVRPVAIALRTAGGAPARAAAFVGDQTLLDSLLRVVRMPALECEVTVLAAIPAGTAADRRELALLASATVGRATGVGHGVQPDLLTRQQGGPPDVGRQQGGPPDVQAAA